MNRWLHLSSSLWEIPLLYDLFRKRKDQKKFPFITTNNWIVFAVQWYVKYFFAPNSPFKFPIIPEKWWKKKEEEKQLPSVLLFKQSQKIHACFFAYFLEYALLFLDENGHEECEQLPNT